MSKTLTGPEFTMVDFKKRSDIHWARKIWHMGGVSMMALAYSYMPQYMSLSILAAAFLLFVPVDLWRQRSPALNDFLVHLFKPVLRENEAAGLAGTSYLLLGVVLIAYVSPREVVQLSLLYLAFADPFASYFGIRYGKDKIFGHKSVQGALAAFVICALLTLIFLYVHGMLLDRIWIVSLLGGLIGSLGELIPFWKLDDNLTLPVFSATFLWLLFSLFGAI